jgi:hypothetical protein
MFDVKEILFALVMGFCVVSVVSFVILVARVGFVPTLLSDWLGNVVIGYPVAISMILVLPVKIKKLISKVIKEKK